MPALSWRIPSSGDPRLLRFSLAHIGLASIVAALVIAVATPREWVAPALLGLVPLALFMAYRRWHSYQQSLFGPDNVHLDETGLHWLDAAGQSRSFPREAATCFRIGPEPDTLRPVPSLTLHLQGGFESQPIELHAPATPEAVRSFLANSWQLAERPIGATSTSKTSYDTLVDIYGECHEEFQEWHWEGTREELMRFFELFAATASDALPPVGAKPAPRIIVMQRRATARLALAHWPASHFDHESIAAPAGMLRKIAGEAHTALTSLADEGDAKFDVELGRAGKWTFHLHARRD